MPPLFRRSVLLALLWLLAAPVAWATHIVGGELDLLHQTGSTYTLTLTLYFDAINGNPAALDQSLTAGIFDKGTNRQLTSVELPLVGNTFVNYTNPACATGALSTRKLVYRKDILLDAGTYTSAQGYYAAVERCCRNVTIGNIVSPGAAAQTFYLEFPAVVRGGQPFYDSTPRIFPALGDYACVGSLFYYDFGGQDPDGDSLAYDMVTPLNGHATAATPSPASAAAPYTTVTWISGLGVGNQIPGAPALGINASTGRLTVRPSRVGLFVFGVRCAEYRRGVKIGETRRDFQLYVLACPPNNPPVVTVRTAAGRPYRPGRDTLRFSPGNLCLTVRYTDPDANSTLTLSTQPLNFTTPAPAFTTAASGTVRGAGLPDTLAATLCFPACTDTKGRVYRFNVIVADNGCSLPKHDTIQVAFTATTPPNAAPVLASSFPPAAVPDVTPTVVRVALGVPYSATLLGTDADHDALTLTATGNGFQLADAGMGFTAQNGTSRATGTFTWNPTCGPATASAARLLVRFQLTESNPCAPQPQARVIHFEVVRPPDSLAFRPPNVITPNGDGLNETFTLDQALPPDFCDNQFAGVSIFSRWGRLVYQSPTRSFSWGGSGLSGLYYYLVTFTDGRRFKGWVEVIP